MTSKSPSIYLQLSLYINLYFFPLWSFVTALFLYLKFGILGDLTKFLSLSILGITCVIEVIRLYFGYKGNLSFSVSELAGFCMLTILMQLPLASFFLFNSYLQSTPTESVLHVTRWTMLILQLAMGYFTLKRASEYAKYVYVMKAQGLPLSDLNEPGQNKTE